MEYIYHSHMDLMLEALSYLMIKSGDTPMETKLSRLELLGTQGDSAALLKSRIAAVRNLYHAVDSQYTFNIKELGSYFTPFSIGQGNIATMLLLSFFDPVTNDWEAQEKSIREKFEAFTAADSQPLSKLYLASLREEVDSVQEAEKKSLIAQLDETGLKDEEKWSILRTIQNAGRELTNLTRILLPVKELIAASLSSVMPLLEDFRLRWDAYFQTNAFPSYLTHSIGMDAGDISDYTLHVFPSLFHGDVIMLNMDEDTKNFYLQIGVCLPEGLNVKAIPIENTQLLEGLKALSDKSKLSILSHIRDKRSYGQALAKETDLSTATISHHMSALINCGFIRLERVENRIYYQMDKDGVRKFLQQLSVYLLEGDGSGKTRT